jgi:hypothetical protein
VAISATVQPTKKTKREEKVNAEFKNQQSKIVSPSPVLATETLSNPIADNHINLREKEFLSILEVATLLCIVGKAGRCSLAFKLFNSQ